MITEDHH